MQETSLWGVNHCCYGVQSIKRRDLKFGNLGSDVVGRRDSKDRDP